MELAIPLLALGGMFVVSNQKEKKSNGMTGMSRGSGGGGMGGMKRISAEKAGMSAGAGANTGGTDGFTNMGIRSNLQSANLESRFNNYLPNTVVPAENYPITNNAQLVSTVQEYPNPNVATNRYLDQNAYEQMERSGRDVGSTVQNVYSLSGDYLSSAEFMHNNMNPFNGGKPRGQIYNNNNAETILDSYSGAGSQIIRKIEQAPLFKPQDNVQWTYGMPSFTDFMQSRQVPVNRNNMTKPFESIRVGPGLDKGYTADGSGGFNAGMEVRDKWLPKTVDEMRVLTNPKQEYSLDGLEGAAQSRIKNIGIEGRMEKNRPDTFYIQSQDRWLTTTGAERAGRVVPEEIMKASSRNETEHNLHGAAGSVLKTAAIAPHHFQETRRIQLDPLDVGHSTATRTAPHGGADRDAAMQSHSHAVHANHRSLNAQPATFGSGFSSAVGAVLAPITDMLKPNRREDMTCNPRTFGNMGVGAGGVPLGHVPDAAVNDAQHSLPTTIKETTVYQSNGYVGNQVANSNAYLTTSYQPISNQRDTTSPISPQLGAAGGAASRHGEMQYDYMYRQTNNDDKERLVAARTNQGTARQFEPFMNVTIAKPEADRENNRLWAPQRIQGADAGPSVQTYGKITMPQYYNECQGCDRIAPDLLNAFRQNPYTQSLHSVA